ncbi:MAG: hypothetical protein H0W61_15395 [Bacteroidetes bacterium]|nr:hypothetical protein [Bacteroidota bacterium]
MKKAVILFSVLFFISNLAFAQSKKEVKKNNIRSSMVVDLENGKTLNNKKTVFDKNGETLEETDYDKDGAQKTFRKYKYNKDGDVTEEEVTDSKTNVVEKHTYKYIALG